MNTNTKTTIAEDLDTLKRHLKRIDKIEADIARCHKDAAEMEERRTNLEAASYRNQNALQELSTLMRQIESCNQHREKQDAALLDAQQGLADQLQSLYQPAKKIIRELIERRTETIAKVIRPYVSTDAKAVRVAQQTCAYQQARTALLMLSGDTRDKAPRKARQLVAIYEEALKPDGDLLKFLSPTAVRSAGERNSAAQGIVVAGASGR
ncbi:MAG: hypothetical protein KIT44_09405 [Opitutaceae bacterium]|nr:hypothetical protein [Opitutaceae bacterium]